MIQTVWRLRGLPDPETDSVKEDLSPFLRRILFQRGFTTPKAVTAFLNPNRENLLDPFLLKGMHEAVERIKKAAGRSEKVLIHGDYDVDGVTGAAILGLTLEKLRVPYEIFLPERAKEGYGVSREAIEKARREGIRLLITVDCGISALAQIREAEEAGIETIVLDHHQLPVAGLPPALAILNPLQPACNYPFKALSAGGLAFKLAEALLGPSAYEYFDLAALSTVADLAPLQGENRILVKEGLRELSERRRVGIKMLAQSASIRARDISTSHVGFVLGPRINASGRMSTALTALRLLLTKSEREALSLAQILNEENRQRQQEERRVLNEAISEVERSVNFSRDRVLVVGREGWHPGVVGIAASRLVERYHRPALVIALQGKKGRGSGRSIRRFHLMKALEAGREFLLEFGGHEQAVGFAIEEDQIPFLRERLNHHAHSVYPPETFLKSIDVDLEISFADLTPRFVRELELLEPFGVGNPKPLFLTRGLRIRKMTTAPAGRMRNRSLSCSQIWITDGNFTYEVRVPERNSLPFDFERASSFDLVYGVDRKCRQGEESIVLEAKDAKPVLNS